MDQVAADTLQEALELMHAGNQQQASVVLARFLQQHPHHERAWHMLSYTCIEREKRIYALQRVLEINPDNRAARSQLARLYEAVVPPPPPPAPAVRPVAAVQAPTRERAVPATIARMMRTSPSLVVGGLIVLAFLVVAIAAPLIAPPVDAHAPYLIPRYGFDPTPKPPAPGHPLGLMGRQFDVFYGLVWGTRTALRLGLLVTLGRLVLGVLVGLFAGHYGGLVDSVIMRLTDAFLAFPIIAAAMVMLALYGRELQTSFSGMIFFLPSRQEQAVILTLVVFGWMSYARILRGNVLAERAKEYMEAARATGVGNRRAIFRHLLPNATQGLHVLIASDIGAVVVLVAAFTFIGLVGNAGGEMEADWGQMLSAARDWIIGTPANAFEYWYTYIPVSLALVLFSSGWNLLGDGLRDLLDPRLRKASPKLRVGSKA